MKHLKWVLHPIIIFIFSVSAVCLSLILYIYWYVEVSTGLEGVLEKAKVDPDQVLASQTWVVILVLSILVGIILMGLFVIFVYNQKTIQLYRLQRNFIDNFTHELKTPVTSLKLYLETFLKHELSREDQIKYIRYMVQDADRLSQNINHILDLAKIESKTYEGKFIIEDVVKIVEKFIEKNSHLFAGSKITTHNPAGKAFFYPISLSMFEILLMNLVTNAIKYNESETPRLDIIFKPDSRRLRIRFEDNGIGIPKSEIKKIFRKFYQIGRSEDMTAKGTGIGLHLVESIARIHKAKITAESKKGRKGSVFILSLPFKSPGRLPDFVCQYPDKVIDG
ncbi:MAG: HAMP domain-containing histidine kinase [Deltaproteobacteria bacterium]|nr:HAMP domain-containing histidine kinase [Deltaproteobacteria bacterium]